MREDLTIQNVSPIIENGKLAEELKMQAKLENEIGKYKGLELNSKEKEFMLNEVSEGNGTIETLVKDLVILEQNCIMHKVLNKVFNSYSINLNMGVSAFRDLIKETLEEFPDLPNIDYSTFFKYRCLFLKSMKCDSVLFELGKDLDVSKKDLVKLMNRFEDKVEDYDYKDELHLKYKLVKMKYNELIKYGLSKDITKLVLNDIVDRRYALDRELLRFIRDLKIESLIKDFNNKYDFYVRIIEKGGYYTGDGVNHNIKCILRENLDIEETFKEWITDYQKIITRGMSIKIKEYFELDNNKSYIREVISEVKGSHRLDMDLDTLVKLRENYLINFKNIDLALKDYNFNDEQRETLAEALDCVEATLVDNYVVDENSIYYYIMNNTALVYEDVEEFLGMLEGTFCCRYGTPLHNAFVNHLLEYKREVYGQKFFTHQNIERDKELWNYLFSDEYYKKVESYADLFKNLERVKSPAIYEMLPHLLYGTKVKETLDREVSKEQYLALMNNFKLGVEIKHVSMKRMKAIAKNVLDVLGLSNVRPETLLDFREEAFAKGYIDDVDIVNEVIEKIGIDLTYGQFILFINGVRNIMRRDNETDPIDKLERIYELIDTSEDIEVDEYTRVVCSYRATNRFMKFTDKVVERLNEKLNEIEGNKDKLGVFNYSKYEEFPHAEPCCKIMVSRTPMQPTMTLNTSEGTLVIINKGDLLARLTSGKLGMSCARMEFGDDLRKSEITILTDLIIEHNLKVMRRF